jgi:DNA invertase Pin-like site-specific DNA recombinase
MALVGYARISGRTLKHLVETIAELEQRQIGFRSLTEGIDTTTPSGRLTFHIFAALAQFERELIRERTHAVLQAARARGRHDDETERQVATGRTRDPLSAPHAQRRRRPSRVRRHARHVAPGA